MTRIAYAFDASDAVRKLDLATNALQTQAPAVLRRGYERAGEIYLEAMRARFDRGGDGWPKLAPSTVRRKGHATILVETGKLKKSLTRGAPGNVFAATPNGIEVGSNDRLLPYHQRGTARIPQRKVIVPPNRETFRRMLAAVEVATFQMLQPYFGNRFASSPSYGPPASTN